MRSYLRASDTDDLRSRVDPSDDTNQKIRPERPEGNLAPTQAVKVKPPLAESTQGSVHLDALRGAAALLVFLNHTRALYFASFLAAVTPPLLQAGSRTAAAEEATVGGGEIKVASAAVVIFFVLSGYLVGGSILRALRSNRWSWTPYLTKRLVRLLVVLIPAVLIGATLDHVGLRIFGPGSIYTAPEGLHLMVSADLQERLRPLVLVGNIAFLQGILVPIEGTNVSLWSLANEFWYYLAFPLAVSSLFPQFRRGVRVLSLALACAILWFVGLKISILFPIWIMGAVVSILPSKLGDSGARLFSLLSTGALVLGVLTLRLLHMEAVLAEYIIGLLSAVLLYGLIAQTGPARPGIYRRVAGFFSNISYSLYLFHLPCAVFLCALLNSPWQPHRKTWRTLSWFALSDLVILAVVYLFWLVFESKTELIRARIFRAERGSAR